MTVTVPGGTFSSPLQRVTALSWAADSLPGPVNDLTLYWAHPSYFPGKLLSYVSMDMLVHDNNAFQGVDMRMQINAINTTNPGDDDYVPYTGSLGFPTADSHHFAMDKDVQTTVAGTTDVATTAVALAAEFDNFFYSASHVGSGVIDAVANFTTYGYPFDVVLSGTVNEADIDGWWWKNYNTTWGDARTWTAGTGLQLYMVLGSPYSWADTITAAHRNTIWDGLSMLLDGGTGVAHEYIHTGRFPDRSVISRLSSTVLKIDLTPQNKGPIAMDWPQATTNPSSYTDASARTMEPPAIVAGDELIWDGDAEDWIGTAAIPEDYAMPLYGTMPYMGQVCHARRMLNDGDVAHFYCTMDTVFRERTVTVGGTDLTGATTTLRWIATTIQEVATYTGTSEDAAEYAAGLAAAWESKRLAGHPAIQGIVATSSGAVLTFTPSVPIVGGPSLVDDEINMTLTGGFNTDLTAEGERFDAFVDDFDVYDSTGSLVGTRATYLDTDTSVSEPTGGEHSWQWEMIAGSEDKWLLMVPAGTAFEFGAIA